MKKVITLLLALTMVFALAACGGKDDPKPSGGGTLGNREDNAAVSDPDEDTYDKVEDAIDALPESKVEIKGDAVVQTTPAAGGGMLTVEFIYDGDQLKTIKLTSVGTAELDDASFNSLKAELEAQGYGDFKKSGKTITAVCEDIESSAYSYFATFNKENLKAALEGVATGDMSGGSGGGGQTADYRIDWADIKAKLEQWIGAPLEDLGMPDVLGYMYINDNMNVNLYYYEETMAGMEQCTVMVELY